MFGNYKTLRISFYLLLLLLFSLIENNNDLNGNASTRLMKSIITSNRDLQKTKQQASNKISTTSPTPPTPPIGTQFALTMLGMHKNASNSLQQHVSSTLGTLIQVQNSFSSPTIPSPNDKTQTQPPPPSPSPTQNRLNAQKSSTLDSKKIFDLFVFLDIFIIISGVSSSDTVEFGTKRTPFSPTLGSGKILSIDFCLLILKNST